jgi:hypothetical protein
VPWILSLPAMLVLGWGIAGLLWWHRRRRVMFKPILPWAMTGMTLVSVAMALLLATVPAPFPDQVVRAAILIEGAVGLWILLQDVRGRSDDGRP